MSPATTAVPRAPHSHLPGDLLDRIDEVMGDTEFCVYVMDGQDARTHGDPDDWHDALVLAEPDPDHPHGQLVKFTRRPDGVIEHYRPDDPNAELVTTAPHG